MSAAEEEALAVDVALAWRRLEYNWEEEEANLKEFELHLTRPSHMRGIRSRSRNIEEFEGLSASDGYAEAILIGDIICSMIDKSVEYEERLEDADQCLLRCNELARDSVEYVNETKHACKLQEQEPRSW